MKKFATTFLTFFALAGFLSSGFAQTGNMRVLLPGGQKPVPAPAPFVAKKSFINLGNSRNNTLANEVLGYFSPEMFDQDGQLVDGQWTLFNIPDTTEITGSNPPEADGTYITNQMMERFTSETITPIYLDSVRLAFVVDTVPTRIAAFVYQDTLNAAGNPVPNFRYKNYAGQLTSASIPRSAMSDTGQFTTYTINFKHKKLDLDPAAPQSFYVAISTLATTTGNPFFTNPASKNRIRVLTDRVVDASGRDYDPAIDRSWQSRTKTDNMWVQANPMAKRYFVNMDETQLLYPNLYMIAFISEAAVGVNDVKLDGNALAQNFPNPFNPTTEIKYSLATGGQTTMKVINALGSEVASLVDGFVGAGEHTATFDGSNLPSGTYFYSLKCGEYSATKRMVLSK